MAAVGIFYGTSTGSTQTVANEIYKALGSDIAAKPVDIETLDPDQELSAAFAEHDALIVGTPTWNTGADTERSGTGWDELYYKQLPKMKSVLNGKKVAVFGLGDQISYSDNYADATGELYDVFESLGCNLMGAWSMEGYEHEDSKSIRGDKFCGLLLDMVNQEELTQGRVQKWVAQLKSDGFLQGGGASSVSTDANAPSAVVVTPAASVEILEESSRMLDENIASHSTSGGFTPHYNPTTAKTMWTSSNGRESFITTTTTTTAKPPSTQATSLSP
jgi:flavodoxin I